MLFLLLAVLCSTIKGYGGKRISEYGDTASACVRMQLIRLVLCSVVGLVMLLLRMPPVLFSDSAEFFVDLLSGASTALFVISWTLAAHSDAYMLVTACNTAAFIVPMVFGFFFFDESITLKQIFGIAAIVIAVFFLVIYNNKIKAKFTWKGFFMLLLLFFSQGFVNVAQKLYTYRYPEGSNESFQFFTFLIAAVCLAVWEGVHLLRNRGKGGESDAPLPMKKVLPFLVVMAVCLFLASYFLTLATKSVASVVLFPMNSLLCLATATLMAVFFFGEKITWSSAVGLAFTFASLFLVA